MSDAPVVERASKLDVSGYTPPDKRFGKPFIDIDEARESPRQLRYIHGGFEGTHTRFSFYFPPKALYQGRFFQFLEGGAGGHENLLASSFKAGLDLDWAFGVTMDELGGYCCESNQGHFPGEGTGFGNDIELWGASAETALFGKYLAGLVYGEEPHHGYIWGVSGGGGRSGHCLEQRPDIWQGGSPHAGIGQTTQWSTWSLLWLLAREKFPQIIDACEPGGSGDPFAGLSHAQREALADMYRRGYPRGAENQLCPFTAWAFRMYALMEEDPAYFEDFWNKPGYRGHDEPQSLASVRVSAKATVKQVFPASKVNNVFAQMHGRMATAGAGFTDPTWGVKIDTDVELDLLYMSKIKVLTGKAAGRELLVCGLEDGVVSPFSEITPDVFEGVVPGDELMIDNRDFVAYCHHHLYTIAGTDGRGGFFRELDPWAVDGRPVYPQREKQTSMRSGPLAYKAAMSAKVIYVQPTLDNMVWPTSISTYHELVRRNLGERIDENFRVWFVDNACHGAPDVIGPMMFSEKDPGVWLSRLVSYDGATSQVLRDIVAWVEKGIEPHRYADYEMSRDNQLLLKPTAAERGGIQPIVTLTAEGGARAEVRVGEPVNFLGVAEQPAGAGTILAAHWDFEGTGAYQPVEGIDGESTKVELRAVHAFARPGTYFTSFRVGAHCEGKKGRGLLVQNLARVRVVVSAA